MIVNPKYIRSRSLPPVSLLPFLLMDVPIAFFVSFHALSPLASSRPSKLKMKHGQVFFGLVFYIKSMGNCHFAQQPSLRRPFSFPRCSACCRRNHEDIQRKREKVHAEYKQTRILKMVLSTMTPFLESKIQTPSLFFFCFHVFVFVFFLSFSPCPVGSY